MKSLHLTIGISLLLTGCAVRHAFVALPQVNTADLTDSREPKVMAETAATTCTYATPYPKQLAGLKLAQDAHRARPEDPDIARVLARCAYFVLEGATQRQFRADVARVGKAAAWVAGADQDQPVAAYYFGAFWGQLIRRQGLSALGDLPELERVFLRAAEHPETEYGGPLRALGMLYLKAPAWPRSLGDLELALEYLQSGVEQSPDFPMNHICYAEALIEDGSINQAQHQLDLAVQLLESGAFGSLDERWAEDVARLRRRIQE